MAGDPTVPLSSSNAVEPLSVVPERNSQGQRLYPPETQAWLELAKLARLAGFGVAAVAEFLNDGDFAQHILDRVQVRIAELRAVESKLKALRQEVSTQGRGDMITSTAGETRGIHATFTRHNRPRLHDFLETRRRRQIRPRLPSKLETTTKRTVQ